MSEGALHPTPRRRDVMLEQVRAAWISLRREALVIAIVIGIVTVFMVVDIARGRGETWFDSDDWTPIGALSFILPFALWRRENRFGPAFLWTLPVDRRILALAKVFGGWVWLMGALTAIALWEIVLATIAGVEGARTIPLLAFAGTTALYLFGSVAVLALRHPTRWLLGTAALLFVLGNTVDPDVVPVLRSASALTYQAAAQWQTLPLLARGSIATILPIGAGLAALWAAASRHREQRRH